MFSVIICSIDPQRFASVKAMYERIFADHHPFSREEIEALLAEAAGDRLTLVTTEKDIARLRGAEAMAASAGDIAAFGVTLVFDDAAKLRKFVADRLFKAREKKYQARN